MTHHVQMPTTAVPLVVTPSDLSTALDLLAEPNARPIAGGTDLMVELDRGEHSGLETLVDLTRIGGLDTIERVDDIITIGPLVTHNQAVASDLLRTDALPLVQACWEVGSPQLRNRATLAGNIVTASPANDTLSALAVLDAELTLTSHSGERRVSLADFHIGVRKTLLEHGELLTAISFPALDDRWRGAYLKLGLRRAQAISVVHLAALCRFESDDPDAATTDVRLALGSAAPTIVRVPDAEAALVGGVLDDAAIARAVDLAGAAVTPIDDLRATADYRVEAIGEMVRRAFEAIRADNAVVPERPPLLWGRSDGRWPTGNRHRGEHRSETPIDATVNGDTISHPRGGETLLDWLRSAGATGAKEGCAEGECGSCTVNMDGMAVLSCLVPASRADATTITTIEGLGTPTEPTHPLQQAFIETGAVQCGFCIPGFLMSGAALLDEHPKPTDEQITLGLSGNLCRCTGYYKIEDAVRVALKGVDR